MSAPRTEHDRIPWLDAAKAIAVLSVCLLHAAHWVSVVGGSSPAVDWVMARLLVPLPIFFLLSGILAGGLVRRTATASDVIRRVVPLLWVYLLWQPVILVYRVVGDVFVSGEPVSWTGEVLRVVAAPVRPNGELWYLWALALYLVLVWATRRVPLSWLLVPAAVAFVVWGGFGQSIVGAGAWHALGPGLQGLPQFVVFALLGARCGPQVLRVVERTPWPVGVVVVLGWQAVAAVTSSTTGTVQDLSGVVQVVLGVSSTLLVSRAACSTFRVRSLRAVGRDSLALYLGHTVVMVVALAIVVSLGGGALIGAMPTVSVFAAVAIGSLVPLVVYRGAGQGRLRLLFTAPTGVRDRVARRRSARTLADVVT